MTSSTCTEANVRIVLGTLYIIAYLSLSISLINFIFISGYYFSISITVDEIDDYLDEDADATEMSVGQMLGRHAKSEGEDEDGYGYEDEEDY